MTTNLPISRQVKLLTNTRKKGEVTLYSGTEGKHRTASYWDSGSRYYYTVLNIKTGKTSIPPSGVYPSFAGEYTLSPGEILIQTGSCNCKDTRPFFYCLESDKEEVISFLK